MVRFRVRVVVFIESPFVVLSCGSSNRRRHCCKDRPFGSLPIPTTEQAAFPFTCCAAKESGERGKRCQMSATSVFRALYWAFSVSSAGSGGTHGSLNSRLSQLVVYLTWRIGNSSLFESETLLRSDCGATP
jgi:hypothetical protein